MLNKLKKGLISILPGIIISVAAGFMLCVYAPMELYLGNQSEFWFGITDIMPMAWAMFAAVVVLGTLFFAAAKKIGAGFYNAAVIIAFGIFLCLYAEGNFLVGNLPPLDGTKVNFSDYPAERIKCIILWAVVACALGIAWKKFGAEKLVKWFGYASLMIFGMIAITAVTLRLTTPLLDREKTDMIFTERAEFEFSDNENVIVLVLDTTSQEYFEKVLQDYPQYNEVFKDFTSFDNTLAAYPYTSRSVPYILGGEWYDNSVPFQDYQNSTFGKSPLLNRLWDENYSVGIYATDMQLSANLYEGTTVNGEKQIFHFRSQYLRAKLLIKMAGLKYAPWDVKYFSYDLPDFKIYCRRYENDFPPYDYANMPFYEKIKNDNPISTVNNKYFKYIHLEGGHVPWIYNENCECDDNHSYDEKVACAMHITAVFLQRLKEAGVYDNSAIMITADHGHSGVIVPDEEAHTNLRVNPIMLVKGMGETHDEMQTDHAPISFEDLQEAYQRLLDGKNSSEVFDWKEGDKRERRCLLYFFLDENHMKECIVTGDADDPDNMYETGVEYIYKP